MAAVYDTPQYERRHHERRRNWPSAAFNREGMRVSWGGIWAGVLAALGTMMLLTALGLAIGVSAVDPGRTAGTTIGTGAGIWGALSLLLSLFLGGLVATRVGGVTDKTTGFWEGALVWVVSLLLMAYVASSGASMLGSGAMNMLGGAGRAVAAAQSGADGGIDFAGTADQIALRLRSPETAQQLANLSGMSANEIRGTLEQAAAQVEQNRDNPAAAADAARRGVAQLMDRARESGALAQRAQQIQPEASRAAWLTFGGLLLSLLAAVLGATVGRRKAEAMVAAANYPGAGGAPAYSERSHAGAQDRTTTYTTTTRTTDRDP